MRLLSTKVQMSSNKAITGNRTAFNNDSNEKENKCYVVKAPAWTLHTTKGLMYNRVVYKKKYNNPESTTALNYRFLTLNNEAWLNLFVRAKSSP